MVHQRLSFEREQEQVVMVQEVRVQEQEVKSSIIENNQVKVCTKRFEVEKVSLMEGLKPLLVRHPVICVRRPLGPSGSPGGEDSSAETESIWNHTAETVPSRSLQRRLGLWESQRSQMKPCHVSPASSVF